MLKGDCRAEKEGCHTASESVSVLQGVLVWTGFVRIHEALDVGWQDRGLVKRTSVPRDTPPITN